jgi:hypothetical protein
METTMMQNFAFTPLFIIFAGTVFIALIMLTMRAVIRRDKAMIRASMDEPHEVADYVARWRTPDSELPDVLPSNKRAA